MTYNVFGGTLNLAQLNPSCHPSNSIKALKANYVVCNENKSMI